MRPQPTLPHASPYLFQRLERVKEWLATGHLPAALDASRKAWYVRLTATYLAQHLLEAYRRRVEEAATGLGLDTRAPHASPSLRVATTATGTTTVQLALGPADAEGVYTTLARTLAASDQASAWSTMDRRLATDLSTWALEQLERTHGADALAALSDPVFEETVSSYVALNQHSCHQPQSRGRSNQCSLTHQLNPATLARNTLWDDRSSARLFKYCMVPARGDSL